jgi:hypothetical protein
MATYPASAFDNSRAAFEAVVMALAADDAAGLDQDRAGTNTTWVSGRARP